MKDILTFVLLSVLIFAIVNWDDNIISPILFNAPKVSVPPMLTTVPATVSNSPSHSLPDLLLLGFNKEYLDKGILFYVIAWIIRYATETLTLTAKITYSATNLRYLVEL